VRPIGERDTRGRHAQVGIGGLQFLLCKLHVWYFEMKSAQRLNKTKLASPASLEIINVESCETDRFLAEVPYSLSEHLLPP
jgi:hypothetical protein